MSERPAEKYLAVEMAYPGCWGSSEKSIYHAIAEARTEGASSESAFMIYDAYEGCYCSDMGNLVWLEAHGKPELAGIYDAAGNYLGGDIEDVVSQAKSGWFEDKNCPCALGPKQIKELAK